MKLPELFADREAEMASLVRAWGSERAELMVVYGRRRVGKTALLQRFCRGRPHTFWVASLSSDGLLRQSFTQAVWRSSHPNEVDDAEPGFTYENWERAFRALAEAAGDRRHVVVLDEFPYLVSVDSSVPSVLQKVWDERLRHTRLMLIICGSHIGMMEREVLLYRAPLYGRRTGQIHVRPLPYRVAADFFPRYSAEHQLEAFAVLGGIPAYLAQFDDRQPLLANIEQRVLTSSSYLYLEPQFLLREELREPHNYFAILQAIAHGRTRLNEIAQATGIDAQSVSRYLAPLQDLQIIGRVVPATERQPEKSRKGIYRIRDPFLRFWFRFVAPHFSALEAGHTGTVRRLVGSDLAAFTSLAFEEICRAWVVEQSSLGRLPFVPDRIGAWWDREGEIDILAFDEKTALFGECKWASRPVGTNMLDDLRRKAHPLIAEHDWRHVHYALFSRSGFTPALAALAEHEPLLLIDPARLLAPLGLSGPGQT